MEGVILIGSLVVIAGLIMMAITNRMARKSQK